MDLTTRPTVKERKPRAIKVKKDTTRRSRMDSTGAKVTKNATNGPPKATSTTNLTNSTINGAKVDIFCDNKQDDKTTSSTENANRCLKRRFRSKSLELNPSRNEDETEAKKPNPPWLRTIRRKNLPPITYREIEEDEKFRIENHFSVKLVDGKAKHVCNKKGCNTSYEIRSPTSYKRRHVETVHKIQFLQICRINEYTFDERFDLTIQLFASHPTLPIDVVENEFFRVLFRINVTKEFMAEQVKIYKETYYESDEEKKDEKEKLNNMELIDYDVIGPLSEEKKQMIDNFLNQVIEKNNNLNEKLN